MRSYHLTEEMQQLVVDNMKLVPFTLQRYFGHNYANNEDLRQIGYEALCRAACMYDKNQDVKFVTYAVRVIIKAIHTWHRANHGLKRCMPKNVISLNQKVFVDEEDVELIHMVSDSHENTEHEAINHVLYEQVAELCPLLAQLESGDITGQELARERGVSRQRIHDRIRNEKRKARVKLGIRVYDETA